MENIRVRNKDGEEKEVKPSNLNMAVSDGFLPVVSNGEREARVKPANLQRAEKDGFTVGKYYDKYQFGEATKKADKGFQEDYSPAETALWHGAQGLSFGLADETAGFTQALRDTVFGDRLMKDFPESYRKSRDAARSVLGEMQRQNPKTAISSQIVGATPLMAVPALNVAKGANAARNIGAIALEGALHSYGASDKEDALGQLEDIGKGVLGAGVGAGVVGGAGKVARGIGRGLKDAKSAYKNLSGAFREGAGSEDAKNLPDSAKTFAGVKEVLKSFTDTGKRRKEFNSFIDTYKPSDFKGTNEEFIISELLKDGSNPVKDFMAEKSATLLPGRIQSDELKTLINIPIEERNRARGFNRADSGEELLEDFEGAYKATRKATGKEYERLVDEARSQFQDVGSDPVDLLKETLRTVSDKRQTRNLSNIYLDALDDLQKDFAEVGPEEQFDRLLDLRRQFKRLVNWSSKNELPESQKILKDTYDDLNFFLQDFVEQKDADTLYKTFKNFETDLFKKVADVERGSIKNFDSIKLEKLFKESDSGRRLMKQITKAEQALKNGELTVSEGAELKKVIDEIKRLKALSDSKRLIDAANYKQGPTSASVERQSAAMGNSEPIKDFINSPSGTINQMDQFFPEQAQKRFGKRLSELTSEEQNKIIKLWIWSQKNKDDIFGESKAWEKIIKQKPKK